MRTTRLVRRWSPSRASANVACAHSGADNSTAVSIMAWFLSLFSMSFILSPLSSNCLRRQKSSLYSFFLFRDDFSFLFTLSSSLNSFSEESAERSFQSRCTAHSLNRSFSLSLQSNFVGKSQAVTRGRVAGVNDIKSIR